MRYLAEREFEALKERVSGKRMGFRRVSCINASLPLSHIASLSDDLSSSCKVCLFPSFTHVAPIPFINGLLNANPSRMYVWR